MNLAGLAAGLYPGALIAANVAVGAALYSIGAFAPAALVLVCGLFVLAGFVSAASPAVRRPSGEAV